MSELPEFFEFLAAENAPLADPPNSPKPHRVWDIAHLHTLQTASVDQLATRLSAGMEGLHSSDQETEALVPKTTVPGP